MPPKKNDLATPIRKSRGTTQYVVVFQYAHMSVPRSKNMITMPPRMPSTQARTVSSGKTSSAASTRGTMRRLMKFTPSVRRASICSVTRIEPSSAVIPDATLPPTRMAVRTGPSSRRMARAAMGPT